MLQNNEQNSVNNLGGDSELIRRLIYKFINRETVSYLIFGVLTTIINIAVYRLSTIVGIAYWIANIVAWIAGVIFAFVTNKLFVFESRSLQPVVVLKEAVSFTTARLLSGVFDMAFMVVAIEMIGMDDFYAKIISNIFVIILNYIFSKLFVFKTSKN